MTNSRSIFLIFFSITMLVAFQGTAKEALDVQMAQRVMNIKTFDYDGINFTMKRGEIIEKLKERGYTVISSHTVNHRFEKTTPDNKIKDMILVRFYDFANDPDPIPEVIKQTHTLNGGLFKSFPDWSKSPLQKQMDTFKTALCGNFTKEEQEKVQINCGPKSTGGIQVNVNSRVGKDGRRYTFKSNMGDWKYRVTAHAIPENVPKKISTPRKKPIYAKNLDEIGFDKPPSFPNAEAKEVFEWCISSNRNRIRMRCDCMMYDFVERRKELGSDVSRDFVMSKLKKSCINIEGRQEMDYHGCMVGGGFPDTYGIEREKFCRCYTRKMGEEYAKITKGGESPLMPQSGIRSGVHCSKPSSY